MSPLIFLVIPAAVLCLVAYMFYQNWRIHRVRSVLYFTFEFADWDDDKEYPYDIVAYGDGDIQYVTESRHGRWWDAKTRKQCTHEQSITLREQLYEFRNPPPPPPQFPEHLVK